MGKALIYARESKYEERAGNRSPEEQVAESREWCEREGHEVVEVIIDAGVGASRHSRGSRDGWSRAKQLLTSDVDLLVTWASSRAQRDLAAYAELRDLCANHGVLWVYKGRAHDLTKGDDRFRTGLDALMDERTADEISDQVQRALRANARQGRPHGRLLYGYRRIYDPQTKAFVRQEPHPDQAPIVRRVYSEFLAGRGSNAIAEGLNRDRVPTNAGSKWAGTGVMRLIERPGYAGLRMHRGEIIGDAQWPPLVDRETWDRAQARRAAGRWRQQRRDVHLLSGIARCQDCGIKLSVRRHIPYKGDSHRLTYTCDRCYAARDHDRLDAWVTAAILERIRDAETLAQHAPEGPPPEVAAAKARADMLRAELEEALVLCKARKLSVRAYAEMEVELTAQIAEAEREARSAVVPIELDLPDDMDSLDAWWDGKTPEQRREIVIGLVVAVVCARIGRGRRNYDMGDYVTIEWRQRGPTLVR